ncbi:CASP-like protein 2B1 [Rutidosis leptorrhynchoides]|uniref:CASP-like protein 2B1 n=1 Tax=Rutidosis leptorrhynchoides TaxID=125765 RepID=UPI003A99862B
MKVKEVVDRRVKVAELILRSLICGLSLVAALLVATDTQVQEIFTIQKKAKFTDMKAFVFLVVANGIAAAYSLVQVLRCVVSMVRGNFLFNKPLTWLIFSGDQLIAYIVVAAIGAAAQSAVFSKVGEPELQWMKVCDMYEKFCNQVGKGIATSLIACASMVIVSSISAFSLFRLYGGNKGSKTSTQW